MPDRPSSRVIDNPPGQRIFLRTMGTPATSMHGSNAVRQHDRRCRANLQRSDKSRKLSMKAKTFSNLALAGLASCLVLVGLSLCAVLNWYGAYRSYISSPKLLPMKTADVRQTLEKCSSETEIQAEVDSLFIRFGDKDSWPLSGADLSTTPGLVRFGKALSDDPIWGIVPSGHHEIGVPSHVEIRFGQHFHYQYILIFRTGSVLSSIKSPFEQVINNVYFKP